MRKFNLFVFTLMTLLSGLTAKAAAVFDGEGYPIVFLRGGVTGWEAKNDYKFTRNGDVYTLHLDALDGEFKFGDSQWSNFDYGAASTVDGENVISKSTTVSARHAGKNFSASNLTDVTISFQVNDGGDTTIKPITFIIGGVEPTVNGLSGTLPVLYINVYNEEDKLTLNNEIIDKDLDHKNYFSFAEYWLDLNGCEWLEAEGAKSIGSKEEPLPLEIKARGNYTRTGFSKKPFKLKLGKKQNLLNLTPEKSKHYAILAHADDNKGYLRNFVGFNLGHRIGLPWTPSQQPIEVVINGDYRGLYFLTESIRVGDGRVPVEELDDNVSDPALISGGYIVELDNYNGDNQIRFQEKPYSNGDPTVRVTFDTPEEYSDFQYRFISEQFNKINDLIGANSDELWSYLDLDDAVRYYLVEEIISHTESYHGSTYLFRDRGEGQKWHFSPLWDCGNAFNGPTNDHFYNHAMFGTTWIHTMVRNGKFYDKARETWQWFMSNEYDGLIDDIDTYVSHITAAAKSDRKRWKGQATPSPTGNNSPTQVVDNTDMQSRRNDVVNHLNAKIDWLKSVFGDYSGALVAEPLRDNTVAAPLPSYVVTGIEDIEADDYTGAEFYNLQGIKVENPSAGNVYIMHNGDKARKVLVK
ncbi:MAG: CotH kinase family protein [Pseudoflavonifractor sp.]|nr:CotH kinase family protein [Pseudoflavonifractor sp.]